VIIHADKNSSSYIMSLMVKQFPQSWLPYGFKQIEKNAQPYFDWETDCCKANKYLGYNPKSLEYGIQQTLKWLNFDSYSK